MGAFIGARLALPTHPGFRFGTFRGQRLTLRSGLGQALLLRGVGVLPSSTPDGFGGRRRTRQRRRRQQVLVFAPPKTLQLLTQAKRVEILAHELRRGHPVRQVAGADVLVRHVQEATRHLRGIRSAIGLALGQDVPDHHQQLARDGDDRFVVTRARLEPRQFRLPELVAAHRHVGRAHQPRASD